MSMNFRFTVRATVLAGVLALLGLSFLWGFFIEVSDLFDDIEFWPGAVAVVFPWIVVLTIALAALMGRDAHLYSASRFGVILGAQAVPLFFVGVLLPYVLGLGDRGFTEFGGEFGWLAVLMWILVVWGLGGAVLGAVLGAVCGALAWGLHRAFGAWWRNMKVNLRILVGGVVLGGAAVLVGVSVVLLEGANSVRGWPIEDARQFDQFSLFWVGEEFEGLPLTNIVHAKTEKVVIFGYGSCKSSGDGGCLLPLSVSIEPCNHAPPGRYLSKPGARAPFEFRGARAQFDGAGELRVWTDDVTITVSAKAGLAMEAANALRPVSEGPEGALKPLGPPGYPCY